MVIHSTGVYHTEDLPINRVYIECRGVDESSTCLDGRGRQPSSSSPEVGDEVSHLGVVKLNKKVDC